MLTCLIQQSSYLEMKNEIFHQSSLKYSVQRLDAFIGWVWVCMEIPKWWNTLQHAQFLFCTHVLYAATLRNLLVSQLSSFYYDKLFNIAYSPYTLAGNMYHGQNLDRCYRRGLTSKEDYITTSENKILIAIGYESQDPSRRTLECLIFFINISTTQGSICLGPVIRFQWRKELALLHIYQIEAINVSETVHTTFMCVQPAECILHTVSFIERVLVSCEYL